MRDQARAKTIPDRHRKYLLVDFLMDGAMERSAEASFKEGSNQRGDFDSAIELSLSDHQDNSGSDPRC